MGILADVSQTRDAGENYTSPASLYNSLMALLLNDQLAVDPVMISKDFNQIDPLAQV